MPLLATTGGIADTPTRSRIAVERRFGLIIRLPPGIAWLSDDGSRYVIGKPRSFARDIGLEPRPAPIASLYRDRIAEALVHTTKGDYAGIRQIGVNLSQVRVN